MRNAFIANRPHAITLVNPCPTGLPVLPTAPTRRPVTLDPVRSRGHSAIMSATSSTRIGDVDGVADRLLALSAMPTTPNQRDRPGESAARERDADDRLNLLGQCRSAVLRFKKAQAGSLKREG